ncbi:MAG: DNA mismatch repair protein MutS [Erysipelothrix sp.]|jgi:DNA mismatch repair protein MutS|nr:DNA mismatch repair protein MutS [Erysipelothrix sp.]
MKTSVTPMMKQYLEIKEKAKDALLFYRLGDFYECFFEDAHTVSKLCDLILTSRSKDDIEKIPMCGVPHHSVNPYILKCLQAGYKVAIAEQLEDPSQAKGIVKRDIVKILTPGTVLEDFLDEKNMVTMASVQDLGLSYGCTWIEVASGTLRYMEIVKDESSLLSFFLTYHVKEALVIDEVTFKAINRLASHHEMLINKIEVLHHSESESLAPMLSIFKRQGLDALLTYLKEMRKADALYILPCEVIELTTTMRLDYTTLTHLELLWNQKSKSNDLTLLSYLDRCKTAMGSRQLKDMLTHLSMNQAVIEQRLDQVETLVNQFMLKEQISDELKKIYDLERIITKIAYKTLMPVDVIRMIRTLESTQNIQKLIQSHSVFESLVLENTLEPLSLELKHQFKSQPPMTTKEGYIFNDGVFERLDEYRSLSKQGSSWLLDFEAKEREKTQIKTLKVGYNKVFGYYIEVSKGQTHLVGENFGYIRKQTLTNAERYISSALKDKEDELLSAQDKMIKFEEAMFEEIVIKLNDYVTHLAAMVNMIKNIDILVAFAQISEQSGFSRPKFHNDDHVKIIDSFHPLLKEVKSVDQVVKNSWIVEPQKPVFILTGPNMGGKSTFMRQMAIMVILAQMGCFVSAKHYEAPIFDAIFTRIGASDDLIKGESTFMVEMNEANVALKHATTKSLILFDEIGRGTSTYDGMAIAQAMIEYITSHLKSKTIFSTHYHELTALESMIPNITNLVTQVKETKDSIEFLYRVEHGKALKSYGINVAKIAHLPNTIIQRAQTILKQLEEKPAMIQSSFTLDTVNPHVEEMKSYLSMIQDIDINQLTPLMALSILDDLIKKSKEVNHE